MIPDIPGPKDLKGRHGSRHPPAQKAKVKKILEANDGSAEVQAVKLSCWVGHMFFLGFTHAYRDGA